MDQQLLNLHFAIDQLKRNIDSDIEKFSKTAITKQQLYVLFLINKKGKCKLSFLAEMLDVKPSAITVMIDRLEKNAIVKRTHDTADRRAIFVEMTETGKTQLSTAIQERKKILKSYLSKLTDEEVLQLTKIIEKMASI